jgi:hypothetical protein
VEREHDAELESVVAAAAEGASGIAVLVGGSSTGKTRACWQALEQLRSRPDGWRVWHPISPARPEAALRELPRVGPRTVVWLNEAQFYLDVPDGGLGEQIAAGLREALRDPDRAPVLVLATLWPQYWDILTARPASRGDPHSQARELLAGRYISVPSAFTPAQLERLPEAGDPRLAQAARAAEDGQVIQFLAGAPELMARYRNALPGAAALISAAMDARRLGMQLALPLGFLEAAAPGYLSGTDWDSLPEDWLEQALAYTAAPSKGIRGPLARIRPRTTGSASEGPAYRLADYLEQAGAQERLDALPPLEFWEAARRHAAPGDLPALARHAESRGLYRQGALLRMRALASGKDLSVFRLLTCLRRVDPHSLPEAAGWIADRMDLSRPARVHAMLETLEAAGRADLASRLAERAAGRAALTDLRGVDDLLRDLNRFGRSEALAALGARAAEQADRAHHDLHLLYETLQRTGSAGAVRALIARDPLRDVTDSDLTDSMLFWEMLRHEGPGSPVMAAHAVRAAQGIDLTQTSAVCSLLETLTERGFGDALATLLSRWPADKVDIDDPNAVGLAMRTLSSAGQLDACQGLAGRAAGQASLNTTSCMALLRELRGRADTAADRLAERYAADAPIDDPLTLHALSALHHSGTPASVSTLAKRLADNADLTDIRSVAALLHSLHGVGMDGLLRDQLHRVSPSRYDPAHPAEVTSLLRTLQMVGADQLVRKVLDLHPAATVDISDERSAMVLLDLLEELGDRQAAAILGNQLDSQDLPTDPRAITQRYLHSDYPATARMLARLTPQHAQTIALTDGRAVADLIWGLARCGVDKALAVVLARLAEESLDLTDAPAVLSPLSSLPDTPERRAATERISRYSAEHVKFTDAFSLSLIIDQYRKLGCGEDIHSILASRHLAREVRLSSRLYPRLSGGEAQLDKRSVQRLVSSLRQVGARDQADLLARRAADAGMFACRPEPAGTYSFDRDEDFAPLSLLEHGPKPAGRYRYGREPDGQPSSPWGWQDLLRDEECAR